MIIGDVIAACERLWPGAGAEAWDAPGLMLGDAASKVTRVLMSVDVTLEVISEASERGCQLIISHHPMFLRGVHELGEQSLKGALSAAAIRSDVAVFAVHTNADFVASGVTESLASQLGVNDLAPLAADTGQGRIGDIEPKSLLEFARMVARVLAPTAGGVRVSGDPKQLIRKVAVAGGAGDSLLQLALHHQADVFVTSDLRHHPVQDATAQAKVSGHPMAVIDISHWAGEALWLDPAASSLQAVLPGLEFVSSEIRTDPWDFAVMQ